MKRYIVGSISVILLSGCATTTDPRKGGLFSYNPDAYEKRLDDRRNKLHSVEKDTTVQKQRSKTLKRQYSVEKNKLD